MTDLLYVANDDTSFAIKALAFDFNHQTVFLLGEDDTILEEQVINPQEILRFFSLDPLAAKYPHNSPHAFSENRVVDSKELEGAESIQSNTLRYSAYSPGEKKEIFAVGFETGSDRRYRIGSQQLIEGLSKVEARHIAIEYALSDYGPLKGTKFKKWWDKPSREPLRTLEKIWKAVSPIAPFAIYHATETYLSPSSYDEVVTDLTIKMMTLYYGATFRPGSTANSYLTAPDASKGFASSFHSVHEFSYKINLIYHTLYNYYGGFAEQDGSVSPVNEAFMKDNLMDIMPDFYKATEAMQAHGTRIPDLLTPSAMRRSYLDKLEVPKNTNKPIGMPQDGVVVDKKYPVLKRGCGCR